jgi:hypothetical protein
MAAACTFCGNHLFMGRDLEDGGYAEGWFCKACQDGDPWYKPAPDIQEWLDFKVTDGSWAAWRAEQAAAK